MGTVSERQNERELDTHLSFGPLLGLYTRTRSYMNTGLLMQQLYLIENLTNEELSKKLHTK